MIDILRWLVRLPWTFVQLVYKGIKRLAGGGPPAPDPSTTPCYVIMHAVDSSGANIAAAEIEFAKWTSLTSWPTTSVDAGQLSTLTWTKKIADSTGHASTCIPSPYKGRWLFRLVQLTSTATTDGDGWRFTRTLSGTPPVTPPTLTSSPTGQWCFLASPAIHVYGIEANEDITIFYIRLKE